MFDLRNIILVPDPTTVSLSYIGWNYWFDVDLPPTNKWCIRADEFQTVYHLITQTQINVNTTFFLFRFRWCLSLNVMSTMTSVSDYIAARFPFWPYTVHCPLFLLYAQGSIWSFCCCSFLLALCLLVWVCIHWFRCVQKEAWGLQLQCRCQPGFWGAVSVRPWRRGALCKCLWWLEAGGGGQISWSPSTVLSK